MNSVFLIFQTFEDSDLSSILYFNLKTLFFKRIFLNLSYCFLPSAHSFQVNIFLIHPYFIQLPRHCIFRYLIFSFHMGYSFFNLIFFHCFILFIHLKVCFLKQMEFLKIWIFLDYLPICLLLTLPVEKNVFCSLYKILFCYHFYYISFVYHIFLSSLWLSISLVLKSGSFHSSSIHFILWFFFSFFIFLGFLAFNFIHSFSIYCSHNA